MRACLDHLEFSKNILRVNKNFVQEEEKVREFGVTSHMHALESEVEYACNEEDPASDKQTSKYE